MEAMTKSERKQTKQINLDGLALGENLDIQRQSVKGSLEPLDVLSGADRRVTRDGDVHPGIQEDLRR